jgi:hypothetical protein
MTATETTTTDTARAGRDWRAQAVCVGTNPELFFPVAEAGPVLDAQNAAAKAVCARCPVRTECLTEALARIPYGIAGGMTEDERRTLRHHGRQDRTPATVTAPAAPGDLSTDSAEGSDTDAVAVARSGGRSAVKLPLTSGRAGGRPARVVENTEFTAFGRRVLRAAGRRVAAGDVDALPALASLATEVDAAIADAVAGLRQAGYSWGEIAARLGVTRQAAHQRWATAPTAPTDAGSTAPVAATDSAASTAERGAA